MGLALLVLHTKSWPLRFQGKKLRVVAEANHKPSWKSDSLQRCFSTLVLRPPALCLSVSLLQKIQMNSSLSGFCRGLMVSSSCKSGAGRHLKPVGQGGACGPGLRNTGLQLREISIQSLSGCKGSLGLNAESCTVIRIQLLNRKCEKCVFVLAQCPRSPVLWPWDQKRAPLFLWWTQCHETFLPIKHLNQVVKYSPDSVEVSNSSCSEGWMSYFGGIFSGASLGYSCYHEVQCVGVYLFII